MSGIIGGVGSKSKIVGGGVVNTSGAITTTGAFTSTGIDDNSNALAMTIDVDEKVGIGVTNPGDYDGTGDKLVVGDGSGGNRGITIVSHANNTGSLNFADGTTGTEPYKGYVQYQHSTANIMRFGTDGATRMSIDSSGRVTTPYQPAFRAYLSANQTSNNNWAAVSLNSTSFNIGNHFNTSSSGTNPHAFTAPVAGRYFLSGTFQSMTACSYMYVSLYINDATMPYLEGRNSGTYGGDMTLSGSLVADLAANDSITLYCYNNTADYTIGGTVLRSSMSGYLIG